MRLFMKLLLDECLRRKLKGGCSVTKSRLSRRWVGPVSRMAECNDRTFVVAR